VWARWFARDTLVKVKQKKGRGRENNKATHLQVENLHPGGCFKGLDTFPSDKGRKRDLPTSNFPN